jgi:XRE family transcriptional regulator, regulator of sulfur utilization
VNDLAGRVLEIRRTRGLSLRDAERLTGVSRAMLSKVERGVASPTATVLGRIAEGFGLSISELVGGRPGPPDGRGVVRISRADQPVFRVPETGFERRSLVSHARVDLAVNVLPPGQSSGTFPAHPAGVRELLAVARGRLVLVVDDDPHDLAEGDALSFHGDRTHRFDNPSAVEQSVFYVVVIGI